jgi:hypothetical protein
MSCTVAFFSGVFCGLGIAVIALWWTFWYLGADNSQS